MLWSLAGIQLVLPAPLGSYCPENAWQKKNHKTTHKSGFWMFSPLLFKGQRNQEDEEFQLLVSGVMIEAW